MAKKLKSPKFASRFQDLYAEAMNFIFDNMKKGQEIVFATEEDLGKNENLLYELDFTTKVGKYSHYDEYAILSIKCTGKKAFDIIGRCKGEDNDEETFSLSDLQGVEVIYLADSIAEKLKNK